MSTKNKRVLKCVGAAVVSLALLIGGTFAYSLFEHKSNVLKKDAKYQVKLVENFENVDDWQTGADVKKEISVMNMGNTPQFPNKGWSDVFVRVQLKEFMEIKSINYEYYYEGYDESAAPAGDKNYIRFMIDRSGNFVRIPLAEGKTKEQTVSAFINDSANWTNVLNDPNASSNDFLKSLTSDDFIQIQSLYDNEPYYYLKTKKGFPNGQYGAGIVMKKNISVDGVDIAGMAGVQKAADVDYTHYTSNTAWHDHTEECNYPVHLWDEDDPKYCNFGTHYYVEWNMNPDHYMFYSDWLKAPGIYEKWILDPATGWAYWGAPIPEFDPSNPTANVTSTLLDSIKLINHPSGEFFYVIHVDLEAYDIIDIPDDWLIRDVFTTSSGTQAKINNSIAVYHWPSWPGWSYPVPDGHDFKVIESLLELDEYTGDMQERSYLSKYDDNYFKDNVLILLTAYNSTSGYNNGIGSITKVSESEIKIDSYHIPPADFGATVVVISCIPIEMSKAYYAGCNITVDRYAPPFTARELSVKSVYVNHFALGRHLAQYYVDLTTRQFVEKTDGDDIGPELIGKYTTVSNLDRRKIILFRRDMQRSGFLDWNDSYNDLDILDGHQWSIKIVFLDGTEKNIYGSNDYPETWRMMKNAFFNLTGKYVM